MIEILIAVVLAIGAGVAEAQTSPAEPSPPEQVASEQVAEAPRTEAEDAGVVASPEVTPPAAGEVPPPVVSDRPAAAVANAPVAGQFRPASKAKPGAGSVGVERRIPVALETAVSTELPGRAIFVVTEDVTAAGSSEVLAIPAGSRAVGLYLPLKAHGPRRLDVCVDTIVSTDGKPLARLRGGKGPLSCLAQVYSGGGAGLVGQVTDRGPFDVPVLEIPAGTEAFLVLWDDLKVDPS